MTLKERNSCLIYMEDLTDLEMLKDHVIFCDEFEDLNKEQQSEMYKFCKLHATYDACRENLKQMRYAVAKIYFGW